MRRRSFGQRLAHDPEIESHGYSLPQALDTSQNREKRRNPRYARIIAIAVVLVLLASACSSETATTEDPGETVTTTTAESVDTTVSDEGATTTAAASPDTTAAEVAGGILDFAFDAVPEGMWRVETLGTSFDIDIEGEWFVQPNESGWTVLTAPGSGGPGDRDVVFIRPTALSLETPI